jgi:Common central domain of tyrosinase
MSDGLRVRRNIDVLTSDLADYIYAFQKLKEPGRPYYDSYDYFQALHDRMGKKPGEGMCEHGNETFLPWHRAHLFAFEEALRKTDPPRTSNVTVPYWDWSVMPTGDRYPKVFEDPKSPLFADGRTTDKVASVPFDRGYLEKSVLSISNWSAPPATKQDSFAGIAGGQTKDCLHAFRQGFGTLENPAHNTMHGNYIGGLMGDPSTAALDPIFWSFHAYIDLLFLEWQQTPNHAVTTDPGFKMCIPKDPVNQIPFTVGDVLDAAKMGYEYEYKPQQPAMAFAEVVGQLFVSHPAVDFVWSGTRSPALVRTADLNIPGSGFHTAKLVFTGVNVANPVSYEGDIYLTPKGQDFRPQDPDFRRRFLVDLIFIWEAHRMSGATGGGHGAHAASAYVVLDITRRLRRLSETHSGERWTISVALNVDPTAKTAAPASIAEIVNFKDLLIDIR